MFCFAFSIGEDGVLLSDCFCEYHWSKQRVVAGLFIVFPPVKATHCCVTVFAGTTYKGNVLLLDSFPYAAGKGVVLLRDCFA